MGFILQITYCLSFIFFIFFLFCDGDVIKPKHVTVNYLDESVIEKTQQGFLLI